jgi:hypothetical protein
MTHRVNQKCTEIGVFCPVEDTIYGYYPSIPFNAFFVAFFASAAIAQIILGLRYKTWFYSYMIQLGCIAEAIGYGGRIMMHQNPYSSTAFSIQISCLIFAPAFIAAGIYVTLQYMVNAFGKSTSRFPPIWFTVAFMLGDFHSLLLQAIGGGLAGSAKKDQHSREVGTNLMIAGIVLQVITLVLFAALVIEYAAKTRKEWYQVNEDAKILARTTRFKLFSAAVGIAFVAIFLRCVYRIAELAPGWANSIMRDEPSYIAFEGFMILVAVLALTVFHPGLFFPAMSQSRTLKQPSFSSDSETGSATRIEMTRVVMGRCISLNAKGN